MGTLAVCHKGLKEKQQSRTISERPRVKTMAPPEDGDCSVLPHCSSPTPATPPTHNKSSRDRYSGKTERGERACRGGLSPQAKPLAQPQSGEPVALELGDKTPLGTDSP